MKAWIEDDGTLMLLSESQGEHKQLHALIGQPVSTGIVPHYGVGTAGGHMVRPVSEVRPGDVPSPAV